MTTTRGNEMGDLYSFSVEAMVRGYHVYCKTWEATKHEALSCQRETSNAKDPYAVSVIKPGTGVVGHLSTQEDLGIVFSIHSKRRPHYL